MKIFELKIGKNNSGNFYISGSSNNRSCSYEYSKRPDQLSIEPADGNWVNWGSDAFDELFAEKRDDAFPEKKKELRNLWEDISRSHVKNFDTFLMQIKSEEVFPFKWYWEAMRGAILGKPPMYYPFGLFPSPIGIVRTPLITTLDREDCNEPPDASIASDGWRISIIKVPSQNGVVEDGFSFLTDYLKDLKQKSCNFEIVETDPFNGKNGKKISDKLKMESIHLVDIIAHCPANTIEDNDVRFIAVNNDNNKYEWESLIYDLCQIKTLQIILLSCCFSDHFIERVVSGVVSPAIHLCKKGIPATIVWNPRPYETTLLPFHRAFYWAMAKGFHVVKAMNIARSAILNAIDLRSPGSHIQAFAPRLYLHQDVQVERLKKLHFCSSSTSFKS